MEITKPGPINDRVRLLGREDTCIYLVEGSEAFAILGGGMAYAIPDVVEQIEALDIDERKIGYLVIHHAHFDHMAMVPFLKKRWPWARVTASVRAKDLLSNPDVMSAIVGLNRAVLDQHGMGDRLQEFGLEIDRVDVDLTVSDGDEISLGDLTLQIMDTPGHSSCSMSIYIPEMKLLSASDAGGIPYRGRVFTAANSNFDLYQAGLERMSRLDVEIHLAEHYGARLGEDARGYMARAMEAARVTRRAMEESYARNLDVDKTVADISEMMEKEADGYFLPRELMVMVIGQMARQIAKRHAAKT